MIEALLNKRKLTLTSFLQGYKNIEINGIHPSHDNESGNLVLEVEDEQGQRTILKIAVSSAAIIRLKKENYFYTTIYNSNFDNCFKIPKLIQSQFDRKYNYIQLEKLNTKHILGNPHFVKEKIKTEILSRIILSLDCMHSKTFAGLDKLEIKRSYSYYQKLLKRKYFKQHEISAPILKYLNNYRQIAKNRVNELTFVLKDVNFGNIIYDPGSRSLAFIDFSSYGKGFASTDYTYLYVILLQNKYFYKNQKSILLNEFV